MGFDWQEPAQVWDKVKEEIAEFEAEAVAAPKNEKGKPLPEAREALADEMGDLIFSLVNAARLYGIHPDTALDHTCRKFTNRFNHIEQQAKEQGRDLSTLSLEERWTLTAGTKPSDSVSDLTTPSLVFLLPPRTHEPTPHLLIYHGCHRGRCGS